MANYDGKVVISTKLDNSKINGGISELSGKLGGLKSVVGKLGAAITAAFSIRAVVRFGTESVRAANELANALRGLQSIMEGQGRSFSAARAFIDEYTKDGLIPATNAITAYKNLAMRGYDDSQIRQVMIALKDASAFGRQASYSMGEAVQSATEGLKNENSILVDNAGVTKNVAKMWEEYAKSIGTTANNLTQQQKIQAEVNGILEESRYQAGDAEKVAGTFSGQLAQLSFNFNQLKVAVGNAIIPIAQQLLPVINDAVIAMTKFANVVAAVVAALFGGADITTTNEAIADSALAGADAEDKLADSITSAAKAAKKSLAGFDELNTLQSNGSSGGGAGAAGDGSADMSIGAALTGTSDDGPDPAKVERIVGIIKEIADYAPIIAAGFAGLKLGGLISDLVTAGAKVTGLHDKLGLLAKKTTITVGVTLAVTGIALEANGIVKAIKDGLDRVNFGKILGGGGLIVSGGAMIGKALGSTILGASIGSIIAGIPMYITGIYDAIVNGMNWLNGLLIPAGSTMASAGIGAIIGMLGGPIGAGIGALIGLAVGLVTDGVLLIIEHWEKIKAWFGGLGAWFDEHVIQPVAGFFTQLWSGISGAASDCWNGICGFFQPAVDWFSELFGSIKQTVDDIFYNIGVIASGCWEIITRVWGAASTWFDTNVVQPVSQFFSGMWDGLKRGAAQAWEGVKTAFSSVGKFFGDIFRAAWEKVVEVFSPLGQVFVNIKDGILSAFKSVVNGLITGINNVVAVPFNGINSALNWIKDINIMGITPFSGLRTINVPQIPYLAKGAVLPANKPFLAMVGDQRSGTNVEAPLSTIQEAVAAVMDDYAASNLAGHEATVSILREILEAVLGIHIGDDVIAGAAERYRRKMAVVTGGNI